MLTNSGIRVGQLIRAIVVGLQRKRLFPVEGQHFGKWGCVIPGKHLAITETNVRVYYIHLFSDQRQEEILNLVLLFLYLRPSSAAECHFKEMG